MPDVVSEAPVSGREEVVMTNEAPPTGDRSPRGRHPPQSKPRNVMSQESTTRRGGFLGFMTSLPGVLTAVAGLLSVATGGVGLYLHHDGGSGGDRGTSVIEPGPVPRGDGQVDPQELDADLPEASGDEETTALVNGCLDGVTSDCETLLYLVAVECSDGSLSSCDDLFLISAYASPYQDYGATCGGRFDDWTYAGDCGAAPM
jgi:hypothetical protein